MHVSGYFPKPYDGKIVKDGKEYSIVEIATAMELPPILYRCEVWALTTKGIDCLITPYQIAKDRFDESDWIEHMKEKTWVNESDFIDILDTGKDFVRLGIL
jgi:hypothetical protein